MELYNCFYTAPHGCEEYRIGDGTGAVVFLGNETDMEACARSVRYLDPTANTAIMANPNDGPGPYACYKDLITTEILTGTHKTCVLKSG